MARGRMISRSLSTSVAFARLFDVAPLMAEFAQSLYPLLLAHADDFGREQGDLDTVKYRIHPRSPRSIDDFRSAMSALVEVGLICWYESKGRICYQINKFEEHQIGLHKRTRSHFPPFNSGKVRELPDQLNRRELNRTEGNLTEQNGTEVDIPDIGEPKTGVQPKWVQGRARRTGLVANHRACLPVTSAACERGICVPAFLVEREWLPQVDHNHDEVMRFVRSVVDGLPAGPIGDEPLQFWRAQWLAAHGSQVQSRARSRTDDTMDAGNEHLRRQLSEFAQEGEPGYGTRTIKG